jgi:uncharacterized protein YuzE
LEKIALRPERLNVDYDEENDVLYISFGEPREADDSVEPQEGVILRTRQRELIGITIIGLKTLKNSSAKSSST